MIEPVKSPPMRVLSKGHLVLWLVVSLAFAALVFTAAAQARETNAPDTATEAPIGEVATESNAPPAAETAPPTVGQEPSAAEEPSLPVEPAPPVATETAPSTRTPATRYGSAPSIRASWIIRASKSNESGLRAAVVFASRIRLSSGEGRSGIPVG